MKNRGQIVLFSSLPLVGGHTTITLKLCEMLAEGRTLHLIVKDMSGHGYSSEAAETLKRLGVTVTRLPGYRDGFSFFRALWQIVHANRRPSVFLSLGMRHLSPLLAALLRPRRSYYYHITHELSPATLSQIGIYRRFFSRVIFISPATLELYRQGLSRPAGLDWAVQLTGLAVKTSPPPRPPGPVRFGFLGRLTPDKGIRLLLDFSARAVLPCEIHVAGRGACEEEVRAAARRTGPGRVVFHGAYEAGKRADFFGDFFARIDWLCVPSLDDREGVPTVILEALQFGVPVLATNSGGMRSFGMKDFGPASRGIVRLLEPRDFAAELTRLTSSAPPGEADRRRCREYYHDYFRDDVVRKRWLRILRAGEDRETCPAPTP